MLNKIQNNKDEFVKKIDTLKISISKQLNSILLSLWVVFGAVSYEVSSFVVEKNNSENWQQVHEQSEYPKNISFLLMLLYYWLYWYFDTRNRRLDQKQLEEEINRKKQKYNDLYQAKSNSISYMSHDIRTPLTSIIAILYLMNKTLLDEQQTNYLNSAVVSSDILILLINDIMDLQKIESWKLKIEHSVVIMHDIIDSIKPLFLSQIGQKNIDLSIDIWKDMPIFLWDSVRLKQILVNLIWKAIKISQQWNIRLECSFNNNILSIKVFCTWIWTVLQKEMNNNDISKKLVDLMWWELKLDSEEWKWSEFYFSIPIKLPDENTIKKFEIQKLLSNNDIQLENDFWKSKKILIVDDEQMNHVITGKIISKFGCELNNIHFAGDWKQALWIIENNSYDLILLDIMMQWLDWYEVLKEMLERNIKNNSKVIARTAGMEWGQMHFMNLWFDGVILKPMQVNEMRLYLLDVLWYYNKWEESIKNKQFEKLILSNMKLMIVDDYENSHRIFLEYLIRWWLNEKNITIITNWEDAIKELKNNSNYDVILMDRNMPYLSWDDTTKIIKKEG